MTKSSSTSSTKGSSNGSSGPSRAARKRACTSCRANPRTTGEELAALKIYHPLDRRDFRDESLYRDGEFIKERRIRVALEKKTRFGREVQGGIWVGARMGDPRTLFRTPGRPSHVRSRPPTARSSCPTSATRTTPRRSSTGIGPRSRGGARICSSSASARSSGCSSTTWSTATCLRSTCSCGEAQISRDRPSAGGRSEEESTRRVAPRTRRGSHLRALRSSRGFPGSRPDRRGPLDGVDVRRPRSGGAAVRCCEATVESHPGAGGYSAHARTADRHGADARRGGVDAHRCATGRRSVPRALVAVQPARSGRPQALRGEGGRPRRRRLLRHLPPAGPGDQMRGSARRGGPEPRHRDPLRHPHGADGGPGRQDPRHRGGDRCAGDVAGRCRRHPGHEHHEGARDRLGVRFRGLLGARAEGRPRHLAGLRRHRRERRAAGAAAPGGGSGGASRDDRSRRPAAPGRAARPSSSVPWPASSRSGPLPSPPLAASSPRNQTARNRPGHLRGPSCRSIPSGCHPS